MAGTKETPRQRMIGMMYLVLTAILALNVSKDLLQSFVIINDGLTATNEGLSHKSADIMDQFKAQLTMDEIKTRPYYERALDVREQAAEMDKYLEELKRNIIVQTAGYDESTPDSLYELRLIDAKDNIDIPTDILIGSEPAFPQEGHHTAVELHQRLKEYQDRMIAMFDSDREGHIIRKLNDGMTFNPITNAEGKEEPWEVGNFYHVPLAAVITNITKLQSDVRSMENDALKGLYDDINLNTFKFDTVAARVIPRSNYVLLGEDYEAEVFLAAYSRTEQPSMMLGNRTDEGFAMSDSVPVTDGLGRIQLNTSREGFQTYQGQVQIKQRDGSVKSFPFESEYLVARPSLTVAPTKLKVLYKGIENPLKVSVPGIPSERLEVRITGGNRLIKQSDGTYNADMSPSSPLEVEVHVTATLEDGTKKSMGAEKFRVKRLPKPYAKIDQITTTGRMAAPVLISKRGIRTVYGDDFPYELTAVVTGFTMSTSYRGSYIQKSTTGNEFSPEMIQIIQALPSGSKVIFEDIQAKGSDDVRHDLSPIVVTIL